MKMPKYRNFSTHKTVDPWPWTSWSELRTWWLPSNMTSKWVERGNQGSFREPHLRRVLKFSMAFLSYSFSHQLSFFSVTLCLLCLTSVSLSLTLSFSLTLSLSLSLSLSFSLSLSTSRPRRQYMCREYQHKLSPVTIC